MNKRNKSQRAMNIICCCVFVTFFAFLNSAKAQRCVRDITSCDLVTCVCISKGGGGVVPMWTRVCVPDLDNFSPFTPSPIF